MALTLSNLILYPYRELGKVANGDEFSATGGSATSVIDTNIGNRESPRDPNYGFGYTAFVVKDSAGASAAPEGEYQLISAYDESAYTWTTGTFTAAIASGDI